MKRVLLGMSGGVDSSVSALLLKEMGYEVIGITLELFAGSCCNIDTNTDAKNVCKTIGIPHITYNLKEQFKCRVIDNFIDEYSKQRTPNPCIECNRYMKFGLMYEKAKEDHTLRTDIPFEEFMRQTVHVMMAVCTYYANGFIWGSDRNKDYITELTRIKEMLVSFAKDKR